MEIKRFEIGEKIKCINRYGLQSIELGNVYTVLDYRSNGNVILEELPMYAYDQTFFEPIKSTEIKITAKPFKITVDDLRLLEKENPTIKKEGNNMIESMNLIDLYANKHIESIEKETKEKIEELRKKCDVINKYNELVEKFEKDCDELYLSQFAEKEKNEILINKDCIDDSDMQLRICDVYQLKYYTNSYFHNEEYFEIMNDRDKKINEINNLVKTAKAHVGIAKTKEEVEDILERYGIIKKGKLVI